MREPPLTESGPPPNTLDSGLPPLSSGTKALIRQRRLTLFSVEVPIRRMKRFDGLSMIILSSARRSSCGFGKRWRLFSMMIWQSARVPTFIQPSGRCTLRLV